MYFSKLVEFREFGWNRITISAIAVLFFSIIEAYGLLKQNKIIWKSKSGKSVANVLFIYFSFMFAIFVVYGIEKKEGAIIVNGFLFVFFIPIIIGLNKYKGLSTIDKIVASAGGVFFVAMLILPIKEAIFMVYSLGSVIALAAQPWEIWKKKSPGVVEIRLLLIYFTSTLFWVIYSFSVRDYPLMLISGLSILILTSSILLWVYFQGKGFPTVRT